MNKTERGKSITHQWYNVWGTLKTSMECKYKKKFKSWINVKYLKPLIMAYKHVQNWLNFCKL